MFARSILLLLTSSRFSETLSPNCEHLKKYVCTYYFLIIILEMLYIYIASKIIIKAIVKVGAQNAVIFSDNKISTVIIE